MPEETKKPRKLPRSVVSLSFVSLFTDISSEMIYPLLPQFLTNVLGASATTLGAIEGISESTASFLKLASGIMADKVKRRKPLVLGGYTFSSLIRPLVGLAQTWPFVLFVRFTDRIGKGIRTSPRDALIADVTPREDRGRAFGLNRSLDHLGAVFGPLITAGLLALFTRYELGGVRQVFLWAFVPGVVAILILIFGVKEKDRVFEQKKLNLKGDWKSLGKNFKFLMVALVIFTLGNSTDAFLLLRLGEVFSHGMPLEVSVFTVSILWSGFHVIKSISTYIGGRLSDKFGRKSLIFTGWILYAVVYLVFAFSELSITLIFTFMVYGIYYGLTEPCEKAFVADLVPDDLRGTAFGYYNSAIGFAALPASLMFGLLKDSFGPVLAFSVGACLAGIASLMLMMVKTNRSA